jgi:hypothetical protein
MEHILLRSSQSERAYQRVWESEGQGRVEGFLGDGMGLYHLKLRTEGYKYFVNL